MLLASTDGCSYARGVNDRHQALFDEVRRAVLESPGALDRATRLAAADGGELPSELAELSRKVREEAASIDDHDVQRVVAAGRSEDAVFELILASAFGAATQRLHAAHRAIRGK
jgi:hypothetical protein